MNIKAKLSKNDPRSSSRAFSFQLQFSSIQMIRSFLKYVSLNATICHSCSVASISAAVSWTESISGSLRAFCQSILKKVTTKCISDFQVLFSKKWKAATRCSACPLTTKTSAGIRFCCMNSPGNRGWYPARVHPFSSGNGKGALSGTIARQQVTTCYPLGSCMLWHGLEPVAAHLQKVLPHPAYFFP